MRNEEWKSRLKDFTIFNICNFIMLNNGFLSNMESISINFQRLCSSYYIEQKEDVAAWKDCVHITSLDEAITKLSGELKKMI